VTVHPFRKEIRVTLELVRKAASATERIRHLGIASRGKADGTPVTQADLVSQAVLLAGLQAYFPEDRISAEEELKASEDEASLRAEACAILRDLDMPNPEDHLETWVNYRGNQAGRRLWMVDPIDGTKGFQKGLCYAIAMGLYYEGKPQFGCMAAPAFPDAQGGASRTVIAYGGQGMGARWIEGDEMGAQRIHVSDVQETKRLRLVGSRAHDNADICARFMERTGATRFLRLDSQAKYLMLASGQADLYLRGTHPGFGVGFPWDHCAGQAILEASGGRVTDVAGRPLNYLQPRTQTIKDAAGLVASNGPCHEAVLEVVKDFV
jgi:3'(2'), 5'-bisphosphate nucleotidase